jgi:Na+/melibiose symporter-like transporter
MESKNAASGLPAAASLDRRTKLLFGMGSLAEGAQTVAFGSYLLIFYNQVMGVPAATVSAALMASLLVDAISNPILGHVSDNLRSRWGRRHPFMYAAALPTALCFWMMFNPPQGWSNDALFWYILAVATLGRLSINLYELPSAALTPELSEDYDERTSLMTWRYFFGYVGGLGIATLLFFVLLRPTAPYPVGQLNPAGYHQLGIIGAVLIFCSILLCAWGTQARGSAAPPPPIRERQSVGQHFRELLGTLNHRGFQALLAFGILKFSAMGLYASMAVYLGTYVWQLTAKSMGLLAFDGVIAAMVALFVAPRAAKRFGKRAVAIAAAVLGVTFGLTPLLLRQLGLFLPVEPEGPLVLTLFALATVYGMFSATSQIMTSAMIADVVEDSMVRTGRHAAGTFFAANAFMKTCTSGFGVLGAGLLLSLAEFPAKALPGQVPAAVIDRLIGLYIPTMAVLWAVAIVFLSFYRIDRARHEENVRRVRENGVVEDLSARAGELAKLSPAVLPTS